MPPKYRNRTEIVAKILQSANGRKVSKTRLMYSVFLSYTQIKEYLAMLIENGLIEYQKDTNSYTTTEKGIGFLYFYERMEALTAETA
jgi:predicted transcriptional regulator